jgi:hypothetical protein
MWTSFQSLPLRRDARRRCWFGIDLQQSGVACFNAREVYASCVASPGS